MRILLLLHDPHGDQRVAGKRHNVATVLVDARDELAKVRVQVRLRCQMKCSNTADY
jgi:hypothetical protein